MGWRRRLVDLLPNSRSPLLDWCSGRTSSQRLPALLIRPAVGACPAFAGRTSVSSFSGRWCWDACISSPPFSSQFTCKRQPSRSSAAHGVSWCSCWRRYSRWKDRPWYVFWASVWGSRRWYSSCYCKAIRLLRVTRFLLSVHTMLMAWRPTHIDAAALVGLMLAISAVVIAPFAMSREAFFVPDGSSVQRDLIVIGLGLSTAVALTLALDLVSTAGAVFASQMAYSQTIAGIFWGMIFLGENLSPLAWASLGLVILGFWLVKPRRAGSDFRVRLELRDRGRS